jgi:hypothetical protein
MWFWLFEVGMFVAVSWGFVMLTYKLIRSGHVATAVGVVVCHSFVWAVAVWLIARPGVSRRREMSDRFAAFVLGVWLIGTWVAALNR